MKTDIPKIPDGLTLFTELPASDPMGCLTVRAEYNDGTGIFGTKFLLTKEEVEQNIIEGLDLILLRVIVGRLGNVVKVRPLDDFYMELRNWTYPLKMQTNDHWQGLRNATQK